MTTPTLTSRVPDVIDWLVSAAQNSPQLGAATPAVTVIDGPPPTTDTYSELLHLYIGDVPSSDEAAATAAQTWPVLDHARTRDEDGDVTLTADAWSGSSNMKAVRDQAKAIIAAVELLLRGDGRTGPGDATMGGLVMWSGVDGPYTWSQRQTQEGPGCTVTFRVVYRARLTTGGS
jgi:hypothetical protein